MINYGCDITKIYSSNNQFVLGTFNVGASNYAEMGDTYSKKVMAYNVSTEQFVEVPMILVKTSTSGIYNLIVVAQNLTMNTQYHLDFDIVALI